jgi:hypothetical protein
MTVTRLITLLAAMPDYAVRALPATERHQLAKECLRLLRAAEIEPPLLPRSSVLGRLKEGERSE